MSALPPSAANMLILGRRPAALPQEEGRRDRSSYCEERTQQQALLQSPGDALVALPCVAWDLGLGYLDARITSIRIGKICDPPAHTKAVPDVVHPQFSIDRCSVLDKP
jgi:hypothetical protein